MISIKLLLMDGDVEGRHAIPNLTGMAASCHHVRRISNERITLCSGKKNHSLSQATS